MDGTGDLLAGFAGRLKKERPVDIVSYPSDDPLTYDDLIAFVSARLPKAQFVLVAESFSGPIAIEIAATSSSVAGLVLASSFVRRPGPALFAGFSRMFRRNWIPMRLTSSMLMGSLATQELRLRLAHTLASVSDAALQARIASVFNVDKRERLRDVRSPILCLYGKRDGLVGKRQWAEIKSIQPGSKVRWLDGPHMLLETRAVEAAEAVNAFCGRV
jgi:pimeloyl-ACP methyl ester carboxylesterase